MEKLITPTVAEAEELIECVEKNKVSLLVVHHRRFNLLVVATKQIISQGELGNIAGIVVLWCMYKPT